MALQHNALLFSVLLLLVVFLTTTIQAKKSPDAVNRRQLRPTRGFQEMGLSVGRNFGKRATNMQAINNFLLEWLALETKMRNLRMARQRYGDVPPLIE